MGLNAKVYPRMLWAVFISLIAQVTQGCSRSVPKSSALITSTNQTISNCSSAGGLSLPEKNVEEITLNLNRQPLIKSGRVSINQPVGYTFFAQSGLYINYSTNDNVCVTVFDFSLG